MGRDLRIFRCQHDLSWLVVNNVIQFCPDVALSMEFNFRSKIHVGAVAL
jgi:hypothetical protein